MGGVDLTDPTHPVYLTNVASGGDGGGIYVDGGSFNMYGGTFAYNEATKSGGTGGNGGGFYVTDGQVEIKGGTISNNTADVNGGGFYVGPGAGNTTTINSDNATLQVTYHSDYEDEIARLKQVCKVNESDSSDVNLTRNYPLGGLSYSAWQSFIPLWAWIVLAVILIVVLCSVLYTAFVMKTDHAWIVRVKEDGLSVKHPLGDLKEQFSVGLKGDYQVPTANWTMTIKGKKYNPLLFWHKSGYYISWDKGVITVENKTLATKIGVDPGTDTFIWPLKSGGNFVINKGSFKITLSV
jgi:hypothetical protein